MCIRDSQQTLTQTASLRQDLAQLQARAAGLRQQKDHWESRLSMENDKFQTISQRRYAEAAPELDAAELQLQTLLARQQADAPQTEPDPDELEAVSYTHLDVYKRQLPGLSGGLPHRRPDGAGV